MVKFTIATHACTHTDTHTQAQTQTLSLSHTHAQMMAQKMVKYTLATMYTCPTPPTHSLTRAVGTGAVGKAYNSPLFELIP